MITDLLRLYRDKGLIAIDNQSIYATRMDLACDKCNECWEGIEASKADWNEIFLPHIGSSYQQDRIAIIGLNPHQYGGLYEFQKLVSEAALLIAEGNKKINWGATEYKGTMVFYYAAIYASLVHRAIHGRTFSGIEDITFEEAGRVFDYAAYTNTIKCSPNHDRSCPSGNMVANCANHVLLDEFKILAPRLIISLGSDATSAAVKGLGLEHVVSEDVCSYYRGGDLQLIGVPHPTRFLTDQRRFEGFIRLLQTITL